MRVEKESRAYSHGWMSGEVANAITDNHMINGTKLLNVAGMTRGRRDGILKSEKLRHVVKIGPMHLKGVWYAALDARGCCSVVGVLTVWTGFRLSARWILQTKRKSPSFYILYLSTILAPSSIIQPTPTGPMRSWPPRNAGNWKPNNSSKGYSVHLPHKLHRCIITTR